MKRRRYKSANSRNEDIKIKVELWVTNDIPSTLFEIFIFLSKNSTLISQENCRFFGWKTRANVVVLGFLAVDNFDFTRKIVTKIGVKNSWKCWGFVKIEFFDKNLTFRYDFPSFLAVVGSLIFFAFLGHQTVVFFCVLELWHERHLPKKIRSELHLICYLISSSFMYRTSSVNWLMLIGIWFLLRGTKELKP